MYTISHNRPKPTMPLDLVKAALGEPYFEAESCLIYNRDAVEGMSRLPEGSVDLTVTSPPYNIGKEYESKRKLPDYLDWCERWICEIYKVTAARGAFWLNLGYMPIPGKAKAMPIPYLLWDRVPFYLIQEVVWNYSAGVAGRKFLSPRNEKFIWYVKSHDDYVFNLDDIRDPNVKYPNQRKNGRLKVNPKGKNPSDVWQFPKVTSGRNRASKERTPHPAQFPVAVIDRIIKASSDSGQLVMDPFMGSGSTAEAALALGRPVLGFEINEAYCEIAASRIEEAVQAQQQVSLFD